LLYFAHNHPFDVSKINLFPIVAQAHAYTNVNFE
jgi:hypothetical protein